MTETYLDLGIVFSERKTKKNGLRGKKVNNVCM